jgi:hypothetical protein
MPKSNQSISKLPPGKDCTGAGHALIQNFVFAIEVNSACGQFFLCRIGSDYACPSRERAIQHNQASSDHTLDGREDLAFPGLSVLVTQSLGA